MLFPGPQIRQVNEREYELCERESIRMFGLEVSLLPGFVYDGASIPPRAWGLVGSPFTGNYTRAARGHDGQYVVATGERWVADAWFWGLLILDGVDWGKATLFYRAVRLGGRGMWRRNQICPSPDIVVQRHFVEVNGTFDAMAFKADWRKVQRMLRDGVHHNNRRRG